MIKRADINRLKRLQREENPFPAAAGAAAGVAEDKVFGKRRLQVKTDRQSENTSSVRFVTTPGSKPVINKKLGALFQAFEAHRQASQEAGSEAKRAKKGRQILF